MRLETRQLEARLQSDKLMNNWRPRPGDLGGVVAPCDKVANDCSALAPSGPVASSSTRAQSTTQLAKAARRANNKEAGRKKKHGENYEMPSSETLAKRNAQSLVDMNVDLSINQTAGSSSEKRPAGNMYSRVNSPHVNLASPYLASSPRIKVYSASTRNIPSHP